MPVANLREIQWIHGAANCAESTDPPLQVAAYDEDTFVLRQSKCVNFEAPFLYLLFGSDAVLLHDTGATASAQAFPLRRTVDEIIEAWLEARGQTAIRRIVTHSHGHGDHTEGDTQFDDLPPGSVAPTTVQGVSAFFGIDAWPGGRATLDLGGRQIDVLPTPGHATDHIALFDRSRGLLLTGDMLYPGLLIVRDWDAYRQSVQRLADFCRVSTEAGRAVTHVLGAHIEMTSTPGVAYPYPCEHQPDEHPLPLTADHLFELEGALAAAGSHPQRIVRASFIVEPANQH